MRSAEFEELLTSVQDLVQRAYALGRSDALKQVVEVMQADEMPRKPLALMAPAEPAVPKPEPAVANDRSEAPPSVIAMAEAEPSPQPENVSWWARPPRAAYASRPGA